MKKFRFRFEKVLSYRRYQEKQRQRDLAQVREQEERQKREIQAILSQRQRCLSEEKEKLQGKINTIQLTAYSRYFLKLRQMEITGREMLKKIGEEVKEKRQILLEATKQRKIYEKLKERHYETYTAEYNLLLQKENDEIGMKTFIRNK